MSRLRIGSALLEIVDLAPVLRDVLNSKLLGIELVASRSLPSLLCSVTSADFVKSTIVFARLVTQIGYERSDISRT